MRSLLFFALSGLSTAAFTQLTVNPMGPVSVCGGPTLSVSFTATSGYNIGNVFTAELSDAGGSFASPTAIGSAAGTGSGSISCAFPAGIVAGSGWALRIMASDPPEIGDAYLLPITTVVPPNAGLSSVSTVCSSALPISLTSLLAGSPDSDGVWFGPVVTNGIFDPATDPGGLYQYVVQGNAPCVQASATLSIAVVQAPAAGAGGSLTVCSSDPPFSMFTQLGGSPNAGGTWTNPGGAPQSPTFIPGVSLPGCYTYTVLGIAPCPNAATSIFIQVGQPSDVGVGGSVVWCQSFGVLDLFAQLTGTPQAGGNWSDDDATGALNGGTFTPGGVPPGTYDFTYTVSSGGCPPASATVAVNLGACLAPPFLETE